MQTIDKSAILTLVQSFAHRKGKLSAAEWAMNWLGIPTFGIEQIAECGRKMRYVNLGDTYDQTIIVENGVFTIGSWGEWHESVEAEHCEEENVLRCSYCGEFTEHTEGKKWREVVCEHCGHRVGGSK